MSLIIDTETTGLPDAKDMRWGEYPNYRALEKYDGARIVQLSFILTDKKYNSLDLQDYVIKREGFNITNSEFHSITDEISDDDGIDFDIAISSFYEALKKATHIIAHNIEFDINVIRSELFRRGKKEIIKELDKKILMCTMKHCRNIVKIVNSYGKYKFPSLKELYKFSFDRDIMNAHNSKYDVINLHAVIKKMNDDNILHYKL
jgi:DNA polymerase III epsilon subunit-like protein